MPSARPVVVAYDGSAPAQAALEAASSLFAGRLLIVVTIWEPELAMTLAPVDDIGMLGLGYVAPSPDQVATVDEAQSARANETAQAGSRLAVERGATAEPLAVADDAHPAQTIAAIAEQRDAEAIVVGSRGLGALKSGLLGSTSRDLLHTARRPVLVVRAPD